MKKITTLVLCFLAGTSFSLFAETVNPDATEQAPDASLITSGKKVMEDCPIMKDMTPEQKTEMIKKCSEMKEKCENMTPEQKAEMMKKCSEMKEKCENMTPEQKAEMMEKCSEMKKKCPMADNEKSELPELN